MKIFKNIIYFIISLQEKILTKRLSKTLGAKNTSSRKKFYGNGILVSLDSIAESEKTKMEEELMLIVKTAEYNPVEILKYIENHDTKVFYIESSKQLYSIGENEGFIYPQKGFKALYLSMLTEKSFKLKTDEMFILSKGEINKYYFMYHFYNWYAYKHGIQGLDTESQELLKKYLFESNDLRKLQLSDIYRLKDAIKQDKSAIEFVIKLCKEKDGSKQALQKLKDEGAII